MAKTLRDIKPGDAVEITLKFTAGESDSRIRYARNNSTYAKGIYLGLDLDPSTYDLKVTSPPKPLAVGDAVTHTWTKGNKIGTILLIDGDQAWIKRLDGNRTTYNLRELVRKDDCNCD